MTSHRRMGTVGPWLVATLAAGLFAACSSDDGGGATDDGGAADGGGDAPGDAPDDASTDGGEEGQTYEATITAADGGTLETPSGSVRLTVPPGALTDDTMLSVTVGEATDETASQIYDFGPDGLTFDVPARISIAVEGEVPADTEAVVAMLDGGEWVELPESAFSGDRVWARVDHFTPFAMVFLARQGWISPSVPACAAPCGGDPTGSWVVGAPCRPDYIELACPASGEIGVSGTGSVELAADDRATMGLSDIQVSGPMLVIRPSDCGMSSCEPLNGLFEPVNGECAPAGTDCECQFSLGLGGGALPPTTWETFGPYLLLDITGVGPVLLPYCVEGDIMTVHLSGAMIALLVPEYANLAAILAGESLPDLALILERNSGGCVPDCSNDPCGSDTCGGTCDACDPGFECATDGGGCVPIGLIPCDPPCEDSRLCDLGTGECASPATCAEWLACGTLQTDCEIFACAEDVQRRVVDMNELLFAAHLAQCLEDNSCLRSCNCPEEPACTEIPVACVACVTAFENCLNPP